LYKTTKLSHARSQGGLMGSIEPPRPLSRNLVRPWWQ